MATVAKRTTNTLNGENHTVVCMSDGEIIKYSCQERNIAKHNEVVDEIIEDYLAGAKSRELADANRIRTQGDAFSY